MSQDRISAMLTIFRRHGSACHHASKGRAYLKCSCPLWADGYVNGKRTLRASLGTRDLARARRKAVALESPDTRVSKGVDDAVDAFLGHCNSNGIQESTLRKYRNSLTYLKAFCESQNLSMVGELDTPALDAFRTSRRLKPITASKELQLLRQFCTFCAGRKWMEGNPAKAIKMPRNIRPNDVEPYTAEEVRLILLACEQFGQNSYERLRAKAMTLTLRYTALRLGDVAMFSDERIDRQGPVKRVFLRTEKNGQPIFMPVPDEMIEALDFLPKPRGAKPGWKHFFWNGVSTLRSMKKNADDTMRAVFRKSGVKNAHAHRFRHTLATELIGKGATFDEVADILGNSPEIVRKHYAKWSPARQSRIDELMGLVHSEARYTKLRLVK